MTGVKTLDEARQLVSEIQGPVSIAAGLPYNIGTLSLRELREAGVARVSFPSVAVFSALQAVRKTLSMIQRSESFDEVMEQNVLCSMDDASEVVSR